MVKLLTSDAIGESIAEIQKNIETAANEAGRNPQEIRLMAVTKTVAGSDVVKICDHGLMLVGENRAQELLEKYEDYKAANLEVHFIGHLQTNKVKQIIDKVSLIHSVGSLRLAEEIDRQVKLKKLEPMDILVEVNIGGEEAKSGVDPAELKTLLADIAKLKNVKIKGLMCIPPFTDNTERTNGYFESMNKLFIDIINTKMDNVTMEILSMGMSGDYMQAIKHGSNLVRIGSSLFGKRK